ncbi:O-methyltransferase [Pseudomonas sp.]|uniref:O-methyltransferase n=1 Tax=Pseudomonas sp. TaxID=306 RepID=UPI003A973E1C
MTNRTLNLDQSLYQYLLDVSLRESVLLKQLRDETAELANARWQIAPEQGQFMALLVQLLAPKCIVEVGTFTGYSAICMAQAMPAGGRLICCDLPADYNAIAERYWQQAGVSECIEQRLAPALQTLTELEDEGLTEAVDMIFIDADKANYPQYLEQALRLLKPGGLLLFDNTLWSGRVLELAPESADTRAIQALNLQLKNDPRVDLSMLPVGDGLTLCRKC